MQKKHILVTGGSAGIGWASVSALCEAGHQVTVFDLKPLPEDASKNIDWIKVDVSDRANLEKAFASILKRYGRIDGVVANAGIYLTATLEDTSPEDLDRIIAVNQKGTFWTLQFAVSAMIPSKKGSIVVVSSDQALVGKPRSVAYGMTKAAIAQLCKSTAVHYAASGIRINAICPGAVDTELCRTALENVSKKYNMGTPEEIMRMLTERHPIGRIAGPSEISGLILFLLSDSASFMTGSVLSIDGGYTAQ